MADNGHNQLHNFDPFQKPSNSIQELKGPKRSNSGSTTSEAIRIRRESAIADGEVLRLYPWPVLQKRRQLLRDDDFQSLLEIVRKDDGKLHPHGSNPKHLLNSLLYDISQLMEAGGQGLADLLATIVQLYTTRRRDIQTVLDICGKGHLKFYASIENLSDNELFKEHSKFAAISEFSH